MRQPQLRFPEVVILLSSLGVRLGICFLLAAPISFLPSSNGSSFQLAWGLPATVSIQEPLKSIKEPSK